MSDEQPQINPTEFRCLECGYDLSGSPIGGTCPECGIPINDSITLTDGSFPKIKFGVEPNGDATASMVIGIFALFACGMLGPIAIWISYNAKKEMAKGGYSVSAHGQANAGLIMGFISLIFNPLYWMAIISVI